MDEPENHTLRPLREIREQLGTLDRKIDKNHREVTDRLDNLRLVATGESVLGRYAAAEVDERLDALEKRIAALEERR
jgi:polyhydroxyalkanoate synthesis regulator phasin